MTKDLVKATIALLISGFGALCAWGSVMAAHFEILGFGRRTSEPRIGYLFLLALSFFLTIATPAILWWWLFPKISKFWIVAALSVGVVGAGIILGVSF